MQAPTTRQTLGGRWTTSFVVWAALVIPSAMLSWYQELDTPFPNWAYPLESALIQSGVVAIVFLVARTLRRNTETIPLGLCILFWVSIGASRGLAAAVFADVTATPSATPGLDYLTRTGFWALVYVIWAPLTTYSLAQFASRRRLIDALAAFKREARATRKASADELCELRGLIVRAVQDSVGPVIADIAQSLVVIGPALSPAQLATIGTRLAEVSEETMRIVKTTSSSSGVARTEHSRLSLTVTAAAVDFDQSRPIWAALLTGFSLLPIAIPMHLQPDTVLAVTGTAIAVAVATVSLACGMALQRLARKYQRAARIGSLLAAYLLAGTLAALAALFGPWQPADHQNLVLAILFPGAVILDAIALSGAVGLRNANLIIDRQIVEISEENELLLTELEARREVVRRRVSSLLHGPLQGRLSACAMALNFHAAEMGGATPERTALVTSRVLDHLTAVKRDLGALR